MPRGGKRPGAGRKRTNLGVTKEFAEKVLGRLGGLKLKGIKTDQDYALALLKSSDERIRKEVFFDLINRRDGKPAETVDVNHLQLDAATRRERIRELLTRLAGKA